MKIFHLALGEGVEREFDRAPGAGAGFENHGTRVAPPLPPWPYVAVPTGDIGPAGEPPSSADARLPAKLANGWPGPPLPPE